MNENDRSIYWTLELYDESDFYDFKEVMNKLKNYNMIYIRHDKDKREDGTLKTPHYHVVIKFKNYKWLNSLSEELGVPRNYFQKVRSMENILFYLIHYKEDNKHHYRIEEIKGSNDLRRKLSKLIESYDTTEEDRIIKIINYIRLNRHVITYNQMIDYVLKEGLFGDYRRCFMVIDKCIQEHNAFILDNLK